MTTYFGDWSRKGGGCYVLTAERRLQDQARKTDRSHSSEDPTRRMRQRCNSHVQHVRSPWVWSEYCIKPGTMVQACHPSTQSVEVTRRVRILRSSLGPETHKTFSLNNQLERHQHSTAVWTRCHSSCSRHHPSLHRTSIQYTYPGLRPIIQAMNMHEAPMSRVKQTDWVWEV